MNSEIKRFRKIKAETKKEAEEFKNNFFSKKIRILGISGSARDKFDLSAEDSTSEFLLKKALEKCKKLGAETELVQLRKYSIKPCKACYSTANSHCHFYCSCYPKGTEAGDDMSNKLYDKVLWADAIFFATPVNNFKISSMMALFIDRCISLDGSLKPADPGYAKNVALNKRHTTFVEKTASDEFGSGFLKRFTGKVAGIIVSGHEEGAALATSQMFMTLTHYGMVFPPYSSMYAMGSVCFGTYADKKKLTAGCFAEEAVLVAENVFTMAKALKKAGNNFWWKYDGRID